MKKILYKVLGYTQVWNPETETVEQKECFAEAERPYSEANMEIARREAYGEPEIYDDGQPDPAEVPSQLDVIEAQVTYTAMITDTLLTEV